MKVFSIEEALKDLGKDINQMTEDIQKKAKQSVALLAAQTHAMIVAKAQSKLKSTRSTYLDALNIEKIESTPSQEIWAVTLDKSAKFIEEGAPRHEMIDYLVNGPKHKVSKDGSKYNVIPFQHNKSRNQNSLAQQKLSNYVKNELKLRGLDKTITKDGKPVIGKAAVLNLNKDSKDAPTGKFNQPILNGLTIYQREVKSKSGKTSIKRDVLTFRVVSEKQKGSGMWEAPERIGMNFFEETEKEIEVIWQQMIKDIVEKA